MRSPEQDMPENIPKPMPRLEKGGRLIADVESQPIVLQPLSPEDYEVEWKNDAVVADDDIKAEDYIYMIDNSQEKPGVGAMAHAPHWRNISTLGNTHYTDGNGVTQHYYAVSSKGIGFTKSEVLADYDDDTLISRNEYDNQINLGHSWKADYEWTEGDLVSFTKHLTDLGIRSELYWEIAKVDKVSFRGELIDVEEAREQGVIHKNKQLHPYVGVRLLRTNHRIEDLADSTSEEKRKDMLLEVIDAFNAETKATGRELPEITRGNSEQEKMYVRTTIEQYIKNTALLISNAYTYYHMHSSNLTLLGEIVDTAVIENIYHNDDPKRTEAHNGIRVGYLKDMRDCIFGIRKLLGALRNDGFAVPKREEIYQLCERVFTENFSIDAYKKNDKKAKPEVLLACFMEIARRMLVDHETLPGLKHATVDSWNLEALEGQ